MVFPTITQLFVLYGLLVVAVVGSLTIILLRLPGAGRDLAATQSHLTAIREQLDEMDQRFDRVENDIGALDNRVANFRNGMNEEMRRQARQGTLARTEHSHSDGTESSLISPLGVEGTESENPLTDRSESPRQEDGS